MNETDLGITRRAALIGGAAAIGGLTTTSVMRRAFATGVRSPAYRSIRYARADRFGQAVVEPFKESLIKDERGPVSPQFLEVNWMGPQTDLRQDEHCQVLTVFTPSRSGRRPVLVFVHGGGSTIGGGELPWYDGDKMAGENDIVVVCITFRLGALGYWLPPRSSGLTPGNSDQVAAFQWVQANIDKFGGDRENVTVLSQSAGTFAVKTLTDWGYGQKLYKRAIPMSTTSARHGTPRRELEAISRKFDGLLGKDPRTATVAEIMAAQKEVPGWNPVGADQPAPINIDIVTGWNREDARELHTRDWEAGTLYMPGRSLQPYRDFTRAQIETTTALAHEAAAAGRKAYLYEFDWNGPDTGMGDIHCMELAFLFGDREAWKNAPMLKGADWNDIERLGRLMRAQWAAYARTGNPNVDPKVKWTPITATSLPITHLA